MGTERREKILLCKGCGKPRISKGKPITFKNLGYVEKGLDHYFYVRGGRCDCGEIRCYARYTDNNELVELKQ